MNTRSQHHYQKHVARLDHIKKHRKLLHVMTLAQILNAQILRDGARFETQAKGDLQSRCRTWEDSRRVAHSRGLAVVKSGRKQTTVSSDPTVPNNCIMGGNPWHTWTASPNLFFLFVSGATAGTIPVLRRDLRYGAGTCMHKPRRTIGRPGGLDGTLVRPIRPLLR